MKKFAIWGALWGALIWTAAPSQAEVKCALEHVPNSGITVVSGWGYDDDGGAITVYLLLNGEVVMVDGQPQEVMCCAPRADVQMANPDAPLNTGFASFLTNAANIATTDTSIGIQVNALDGDPPCIRSQILEGIAPLGEQEFVTDVDLRGARISIDSQNRINIQGARVFSSEVPDGLTTSFTLAFTESNQLFSTTANSSCLDPSRTTEFPATGGTGGGGGGCRDAGLIEEDCLAGWQVIPDGSSAAGQAVSCFSGENAFGSTGCFACGPNNLNAGRCVNTCADQSPAVGSGPLLVDPRGVAVESAGTIVLTDRGIPAVIRVDPGSGNRTIVSGEGIGTGPDLIDPRGIDVEADGNLVVADARVDAILRIDPTTGDRTILSGDGVGSGPQLMDPRDLALEADGNIAVKDRGLDAIVRVDSGTGDRTILSGPGIGTGPDFVTPRGIAVEADGNFVLADVGLDAIIRDEEATGNRTIVSDASTGSGPLFDAPTQIAIEADGSLLVTDANLNAIFRVDPVTGDRTIVSDAETGSGPLLIQPVGDDLDADGQLVVTDRGRGAVVRVNPLTGDRTVLSE